MAAAMSKTGGGPATLAAAMAAALVGPLLATANIGVMTILCRSIVPRSTSKSMLNTTVGTWCNGAAWCACAAACWPCRHWCGVAIAVTGIGALGHRPCEFGLSSISLCHCGLGCKRLGIAIAVTGLGHPGRWRRWPRWCGCQCCHWCGWWCQCCHWCMCLWLRLWLCWLC